MLIEERDAQAVELQFATDVERLAAQALRHALIERLHVAARIGIAQREHGTLVRHRLEIVGAIAAHALRRRVGVAHLGMPLFEFLQFVHHVVELAIGNLGRVEHIIIIIVSVQLFAQKENAFGVLFLICARKIK